MAALDVECPVIDSLLKAIDFGMALSKVVHMDPGWAPLVFEGASALNYQTGPAVLQAEILSMWNDYWSDAEKRDIVTQYVTLRLMR